MSADPAFALGVVDDTEHPIIHTSTSGWATTHMRKDPP
jgi:hypothetical protein